MAIDYEGVAKSIVQNGGASINARTGQTPSRGYMVAVPHAERVIPGVPAAADIAAFTSHYQRELRRSGAHLGAWHNPEDNNTYLDVSLRQRKASHALKKGAKWNQWSVYDLGNQREVKVKNSDRRTGQG